MVDALSVPAGPGNRARRGAGRGADLGCRPRRRATLARAAAFRPGAEAAAGRPRSPDWCRGRRRLRASCRRSGWWTRTRRAKARSRRWPPGRCWYRAPAPSGAGTATRSGPARPPRRPCACSSATGCPCCSGTWPRPGRSAAAQRRTRGGERDRSGSDGGGATGAAARTEAEGHLERERAAHQHLRARAMETAARLAAHRHSDGAPVGGARGGGGCASPGRRGPERTARSCGAAVPVEDARAALSDARTADAAARADREALDREHAARTSRRRAIATERADWAQRAADAVRRVGELRHGAARRRAEHAGLEAAPAQIAARRAEALDALEAAGAAHRDAADELRGGYQPLGRAERGGARGRAGLGAAREGAVRAEGNAAQAGLAWTAMAERIAERLGPDPAMPDPPAELRPTRRRRPAAVSSAC